MPMGKKITLRDWKARLESIIREEYGFDQPYDDELAATFWRNGYGPREFFKEHVEATSYESEEIDLRELL